jgi:urease accessory protein UreE
VGCTSVSDGTGAGCEAGRARTAAHLLADHDDEGRERRAAHARDREELDEARDVVAAPDDVLLHREDRVDVVQVARWALRRVSVSDAAHEDEDEGV